jgi:hypothetical protein|tara:strand:- start:13755 stop:14042 length:288 start_codon:yes stop_codon:yes gene_type:complete
MGEGKTTAKQHDDQITNDACETIIYENVERWGLDNTTVFWKVGILEVHAYTDCFNFHFYDFGYCSLAYYHRLRIAFIRHFGSPFTLLCHRIARIP